MVWAGRDIKDHLVLPSMLLAATTSTCVKGGLSSCRAQTYSPLSSCLCVPVSLAADIWAAEAAAPLRLLIQTITLARTFQVYLIWRAVPCGPWLWVSQLETGADETGW